MSASSSSSASLSAGAPGAPKEYPAGSIVRIHCYQFLTYRDVTITPGPRLNMVVGPNGTGKSSIVCAIAIGLGCKLRDLGRSETLGEFVMQGYEKGYVEIELKGNAGKDNVKIKRALKRGGQTSKWYLNDQIKPEKDVMAVIANTGAQIGNLCTFLPQEKVGEFSGFDGPALLVETEKATGGEKLLDEHKSLIETEKSLNNHELQVETKKQHVAQLAAQNANLERDKEKMEQREEHLRKAEVCRKKELWLKYNAKKAATETAKERVGELRGQLMSATEQLVPFKHSATEAKALETHHKKRGDKIKKDTDTAKTAQARYLDQAADNLAKMEEVVNNVKNIEMRQKARVGKIREAERKLEATQAKVRSDEEVDALKQEAASVKPDLLAAEKDINAALDERSAMKSEAVKAKREAEYARRQLAELQNVSKRRLGLLRNFGPLGPQAAKVWAWLEEQGNRGQFRARVHGPVAMEISVTDPSRTTVVENQTGYQVLNGFVTECNEDYQRLKQVQQQLQTKCQIMNIEGGGINRNARPRGYSDKVWQQLQGHGIDATVENLVECNDTIRQVLRDYSNHDMAVVGNERTTQSFGQSEQLGQLLVSNAQKAYIVFASQREGGGGGGSRGGRGNASSSSGGGGAVRWEKYTSSASRYQNGKQITSVNSIRDAQVLGESENPAEVAGCEERLRAAEAKDTKCEDSFEELERAEAKARAVFNKLNERKRQAMDTIKGQKKLQTDIKRLMQTLQGYKDEEARDQGDERNNLLRRLGMLGKKHAEAIEKAQAQAQAQMDHTVILGGSKCNQELSKDHAVATAREQQRRERESADLKQAFATATATMETLKSEAKELKKVATAQAPAMEVDPNDPSGKTKRKTPLYEEMELLTDNMDELLILMEKHQSEADAIHDNPQVIVQYKARKLEIEKEEAALADLDANFQKLRDGFEPAKQAWQTYVGETCEKLNLLFAEYMQALGNEGQVNLREGETFDKWGIEIKVRFRDDAPLEVLQKNVQSGGERSVSTIMFLMALQDMVTSPFRVVDEINQGMDERNERIVFKRIVENSVDQPGKPSRPQYFLITPKLLQGLTAMENEQVTVLFVFNGPFNLHADKPNGGQWDLKEFLKKRKALGDVDVNRSSSPSSSRGGGSANGGKRNKASSDKRRRTGAAAEEAGAAADEMAEGH